MRYVLLVLLISAPVVGQPYLEWKNEVKYTDSHYDKTINYFRTGIKFENDTYFEFGPMTDGESF